MNNLTFFEALPTVFRATPRNSSYAIPGLYDLDLQDATWCLVVPLIIFTMQTGFALVESGVVRSKNEVNIMMKNVVDVCFGGLSFYLFGFGLMYGRGELTNPFFAVGDFIVDVKVGDPLMAQIFTFFFFQMSYATTSTTIVSGACAERFRFSAYCLFSFVNTFVYSVSGGWVWGEHGFLRNLGVVDFAGAGPIHVVGGAAALTAAWFIGPRIGRYDNGTKPLQMGNPMNACMGLFILWWGWIGFNAGSTYGITGGKWQYSARAGVGTTLATMGAGVFSILFSFWRNRGKKVDVFDVVSGILASLVTINAGCFVFPSYISVLVGVLAAFFALMAMPVFDVLGIDDPIGACSVHLVGGIWGQISVGLFAQDSFPLSNTNGRSGLLMGGGWYLLLAQTFSVACLFLWGLIATYPILWIVNKIIPIRLSPEEEIIGCDVIEHYMGDENTSMLPVRPQSITNMKFGGPQVSFNLSQISLQPNAHYRDLPVLSQRKNVYKNPAFDGDEGVTHQQTPTERL